MKTTMIAPDQTHTFDWSTLITGLAALAGLFTVIWRFIDRYFKDKSEERAEFIKAVVREAMGMSMEPIERQIKDMGDKHDDGMRQVNKRIDDLFKELRK